MKQIKIAEFKTHLSGHLRNVQKGEEIIILDRKQPIAKVLPLFSEEKNLIKIVRKKKTKNFFKKFKPRGIKAQVDIVNLLQEMRGAR